CSCLFAVGLTVALLSTRPALAQPAGSAKQSCQTTGCLDTADTAPAVHYRLRAGDIVELSFPFVPTFNQTLTIQPDGYITLQSLGPLRVDGLTVPELTEILRSNYTSILRDPV